MRLPVVALCLFAVTTAVAGEAPATPTHYKPSDTIVVLGRYRGTCRATGRVLDAQLAHVWRVADGRVVGFQQYTDTLQAARVVERRRR